MKKLTQDTFILFQKQQKKAFTEDLTGRQYVKIIIGMGTCGVAAGANETKKAFEEEIESQGLSNVHITKTGCLGSCSVEPLVEVITPGMQKITYQNVDSTLAKKIIKHHVVGKNIINNSIYTEHPKQHKIVLRNCGIIDPENIDEYIARDGYTALRKVIFEMTPDTVIEELKTSGLRGRGGAGYPTGMKWSFTKNVKEKQKYVVCNADEGDPGAYMDRSTLEGDPNSILEAMTIAGYTVGANQGFIYIRAEYPLAIERLKKAINQAKQYGLLGENIFGSSFSFDIEIRLGAGAFVCGEETALLASIEGNRGTPVPRPPYPAIKGLWRKPTVINNVETYANITYIILNGGKTFAQIGTETSKGTKVFALTGKIANSGLIEVPMGTTLRDIIFDIGGGIPHEKRFKAVQTGGPSGGVISTKYLDIPIDYEQLMEIGSMMGSGGMIVMDEDDCMINVTKFYLGFSVDESCGKCAPCRIGGYQLYRILEKISEGKGSLKDLDHLKRIAIAMQKASLCGLGQTASNPVLSTLKYFFNEYHDHITNKKCTAKKCTSLLLYSIIENQCIKCGLCQRICPVGAVEGDRASGYRINQEKCIKCGECMNACRFNAIYKE